MLLLTDAIGPFFRRFDDRRVNWSKIPFKELEAAGRLPPDTVQQIARDLDVFCRRVAGLGFNAITLDDLAHILPCDRYPPALRLKIEDYRKAYRIWFRVARAADLDVFLTTDIMFYNAALEDTPGRTANRIGGFLAEHIDELFDDYPELAGIVTRIGESDGRDVQGDFKSEITIRTPRDARRILRALLPVFERQRRLLVFRTWSVGAYPIGDLMWNRTTYQRVFAQIESDALIVSHKCGESDFFRYLPLNKQFFQGRQQVLIEFQSRREYEGFGEYPSFTGWDVEAYCRPLRGHPRLAGCSVWCQTGGWSSFTNLTFLRGSSPWNELNTALTLWIFRDDITAEEAARRYVQAHFTHVPPERFLTFLRLSDEVIKELLYTDEFAHRKLFFRRLRVPPLLAVFWDNILINHSMRKMLRCFVTDGEAKIMQGRLALMKIREMQEMAREWCLPGRDLAFMHDTFELLGAAREYYFRDFNSDIGNFSKSLG